MTPGKKHSAPPRSSYLKRHWRLVLFVVLVATAAVLYRVTPVHTYFHASGLEALQRDFAALGWRGMLAYLAVYTVFVALGLPNLPFQLAAGAIFGLWRAYALMSFGVNLGAVCAFYLARYLGRGGFEELAGHRLEEWNRRIDKGGIRLLLTLRLIPLFPFSFINYAAGVSRLRLRDYMLANVIGLMPLTFFHVLFGSAATQVKLSDPGTWLHIRILVPVIGAALMLAVVLYLAKKGRIELPMKLRSRQGD